MKRILSVLLALTLVLSAATFAVGAEPADAKSAVPTGSDRLVGTGLDDALQGEGTETSPYLIGSSSDWNRLASYIKNEGITKGNYYQLTRNISVSTMLGDPDHPFSGIFDGGGYTLTLSLDDSGDYCAPFSVISDAKIRNLKTTGTVRCGLHGSALVGAVRGSYSVIDNCVVDADITCVASYCGGFVGHGGATSRTIVMGCVFDGTISGAQYGATFWGWSDTGSEPNITRCLDVSESACPIGIGFPEPVGSYVYYTYPDKTASDLRPWSYKGKLAHAIFGEGIAYSREYGVVYDGKIYAAQGETVCMTADSAPANYIATSGALYAQGSELMLYMPGEDVEIVKKPDCGVYSDLSEAYSVHDGGYDVNAQYLIDGDTDTKWQASILSGSTSVKFLAAEPIVVQGYTLITAKDTFDNKGRNPVAWKLEASNNDMTWVTLTEVTANNQMTIDNLKPTTFAVTNPDKKAYRLFRFTVSEVRSGDEFQLSELQLLATARQYDLWVGSTRVTGRNLNDILSDGGSVQFDPRTDTLTLNDVQIPDYYTLNSERHLIYAKDFDLTVEGGYEMETLDTDVAIRVDNGKLTLSGDFTFYANNYGVMASGDITFDSGDYWINALENEAVNSIDGKIILTDNLNSFNVSSGGYVAAYAYGGGELGEKLVVIKPNDGDIWYNRVNRVQIIHGYTVDFKMKGHGTAIDPQVVAPNGTVSEPEPPTEEGWRFEGWYINESCTMAYDFNEPVTKDMSLYAKWKEAGVLGDADCDGEVTIFDATAIQRHLALLPVTKFNERTADADGDGDITIFDATSVQRYLADLPCNSDIGTEI